MITIETPRYDNGFWKTIVRFDVGGREYQLDLEAADPLIQWLYSSLQSRIQFARPGYSAGVVGGCTGDPIVAALRVHVPPTDAHDAVRRLLIAAEYDDDARRTVVAGLRDADIAPLIRDEVEGARCLIVGGATLASLSIPNLIRFALSVA